MENWSLEAIARESYSTQAISNLDRWFKILQEG